MKIFHFIHFEYSFHVFLLDKVYNLTAISHDFEGSASHVNLTFFENLPVLEAMHDAREDLIEVFVDR